MLFLITKKQRDYIIQEYYAYILHIINIGIILMIIVFTIALFPTYTAMHLDRDIVSQKIIPLEKELSQVGQGAKEDAAIAIQNDISLLHASTTTQVFDIYEDIQKIYLSIPGVDIQDISIDHISKTIQVRAEVDSKNTANALVDILLTSPYKGAELPYSVFSQTKSFIFPQNLTYE